MKNIPSARMWHKGSYLIFICFLGCSQKIQCTSKLEDISFHRGYLLWEKSLKNSVLSYDFEQVLRGMRAAENGEIPSMSQQELTLLTRDLQEDLVQQQLENNLKEAEQFLEQLAKDPDIIELVPSKLYYKQIEIGLGELIDPNSIVSISYTAKVIKSGELEEFFTCETPTEISLADTIPGFVQGTLGMHKGGQRVLYIHPDLAYGAAGWKVEPNQLIAIDVKLLP